ncbi:MAG: YeiH family protein, partial [Nocardioidaceae bacterium]
MSVTTSQDSTQSPQRTQPRPPVRAALVDVVPGLLLCGAVAAAAMLAGRWLPVSPLLIGLVVGAVTTNVVRLPAAVGSGLTFASKRLLRLGIVLLGLQLVLGDVLALGWPILAVVLVTVGITYAGTVALGTALRLPRQLAMLIAAGSSICGAAAIAAVGGVNDSDDDDVLAAVALVTVYGSVLIVLIPTLGPMLGLDDAGTAVWAGASIHEVAQVVAAGSAIGAAALTTAVSVKLARVLLLAPVTVVSGRASRTKPAPSSTTTGNRTPVLPLFVLGFLGAAVLRSTGLVDATTAAHVQTAQDFCLAAAMFALGTGVHLR